MLIEKTKETYYEVLQNSSIDWHEGKNDYRPFVKYCLGVILNAYKEFSVRVEYLATKNLTKSERVATIIKNKVGKITKKELMNLCPDISETTIEKSIAELLKDGTILKIGGGRYTAYTFNHEK